MLIENISDLIIPSLIILGIIMIIGFLGNLIFNRTQIPSIVWLLVFGLVLGFIFNVRDGLDPDMLKGISEFFAAVAIAIILFDGGINTDLYQLFRGAPRGLLLSISGFIFSVIATIGVILAFTYFNVLNFSFEKSLVVGFLLGAIVAGTSSPIVIPLACRLKNLQEKTKVILSIESIITDPLSIVVFLAGFYMVSTGVLDVGIGLKSLVSTFSVGAVVGTVFGIIWLPIMHKVRREQFSYVLTLAVVFLVYSATVYLVGADQGGTGAGAVSCLMFGLILGNGKKILKMLNYHGQRYEMDDETKQFHSLVSFLMRTFFFVYLGVMVSFQKIEYIIIGIVVLVGLLLVRFISVHLSTIKGGFEKDDKQTMTVMMPRGLAAAILALTFGPDLVSKLIPGMKGFFTDITFVAILGTAIVCTIGVSVISHIELKKMNNVDLKKQKAVEDILRENREKTEKEKDYF